MNGTFRIPEALKTEYPELEARLHELPVQQGFVPFLFMLPKDLTAQTMPYDVKKLDTKEQPTFELFPLCHPYFKPGKLYCDSWVAPDHYVQADKKQFVVNFQGFTFAVRIDGLDYVAADK